MTCQSTFTKKVVRGGRSLVSATGRFTPDAGRWSCRLIVAACLLLSPAAKAAAQPASARRATLPLGSRPYRVLVSVSFARDPSLTTNFRRSVLDGIARIADRTVGVMWDLNVVENRSLFPVGASGLKRLSTDSLRRHLDPSKYDKGFVVSVAPSGSRFLLAGREWDSRLRELGPVKTAETWQRRALDETAFALIDRLFHPIFSVERVDDDVAILNLQAGVFPAPDKQSVQVIRGDVIQPFFRYRDTQRNVRRVQLLPWTYLIVKSVEQERVTCDIVTGLRSPLRGNRRRVEIMAVRLRPAFAETRLRLVPRSQPSKPLVGYRVSIIEKTYRNEEPKSELLTLITDRRGSVSVPLNAAKSLVWIHVLSGESLLARVPFLPGVHTDEQMELPDDSIRLTVEGETDLLMNRLIDTVARRAGLMVRARRLARDGDWKNVDLQLAKLKKLPGIPEYETQLTIIRVPGIEAAQRQKDRRAEVNVLRICRQTSEIIRRYLDADKIRELQEELDELRQLDLEDK